MLASVKNVSESSRVHGAPNKIPLSLVDMAPTKPAVLRDVSPNVLSRLSHSGVIKPSASRKKKIEVDRKAIKIEDLLNVANGERSIRCGDHAEDEEKKAFNCEETKRIIVKMRLRFAQRTFMLSQKSTGILLRKKSSGCSRP